MINYLCRVTNPISSDIRLYRVSFIFERNNHYCNNFNKLVMAATLFNLIIVFSLAVKR